jgi:hypothetical protein
MAKPLTPKKTSAATPAAARIKAAPEPAPNTLKSRDEAVAIVAYELWLERGRPIGSPEQDWFRAEQLVDAGAEAVGRSRPSTRMTIGAGTVN